MKRRWHIEHAGAPAEDPGDRTLADYLLWIAGLALVGFTIWSVIP